MVSIDRMIMCRIKNGRDLVTYCESYLVPVSSVQKCSLNALNNFVASIMLLRESVDTEN